MHGNVHIVAQPTVRSTQELPFPFGFKGGSLQQRGMDPAYEKGNSNNGDNFMRMLTVISCIGLAMPALAKNSSNGCENGNGTCGQVAVEGTFQHDVSEDVTHVAKLLPDGKTFYIEREVTEYSLGDFEGTFNCYQTVLFDIPTKTYEITGEFIFTGTLFGVPFEIEGTKFREGSLIDNVTTGWNMTDHKGKKTTSFVEVDLVLDEVGDWVGTYSGWVHRRLVKPGQH